MNNDPVQIIKHDVYFMRKCLATSALAIQRWKILLNVIQLFTNYKYCNL